MDTTDFNFALNRKIPHIKTLGKIKIPQSQLSTCDFMNMLIKLVKTVQQFVKYF